MCEGEILTGTVYTIQYSTGDKVAKTGQNPRHLHHFFSEEGKEGNTGGQVVSLLKICWLISR